MDKNPDLQSWARNIKVWEPNSWKPYLDQLLDAYNQALKFKEFHNWLKDTFDGKSIRDLPIELRDSARMCISGGGSERNAFGGLMFKKFGLGVVNCKNYEQSLEEYERCGDWIEMSVREVVLGWEHYDEVFLHPLKEIIDQLAKTLNINVEEPKIEEDFGEWVKYPDPKLIEKLEGFLNSLARMLEFTNYYTMLMRYFLLAPLPMVARFLNIEIDEIKKLAEIWNIEFVYDANLNKINIEDIERSKPYELFWVCIDEKCLPQKILKMFGYNGLAQKLIEQFDFILDTNISSELQRLWEDRFTSLKAFKESSGWSIDRRLKEILLSTARSDKREFSLLLQDGFIKEVKYPAVDRSTPAYDPIADKVVRESVITTKELSPDKIYIMRFLNLIFPLTAMGFLVPSKMEESGISFQLNDIPILEKLGVLFQ
ncbi:hypothetical protein [Archaeoglobus sp.]